MIAAVLALTPILSVLSEDDDPDFEELFIRAVSLGNPRLILDRLPMESIETFLDAVAEWTVRAIDLTDLEARLQFFVDAMFEGTRRGYEADFVWTNEQREPFFGDFFRFHTLSIDLCRDEVVESKEYESTVGSLLSVFGGKPIVVFEKKDFYKPLNEISTFRLMKGWEFVQENKDKFDFVDIDHDRSDRFGIWPDYLVSWDETHVLFVMIGSEENGAKRVPRSIAVENIDQMATPKRMEKYLSAEQRKRLTEVVAKMKRRRKR